MGQKRHRHEGKVKVEYGEPLYVGSKKITKEVHDLNRSQDQWTIAREQWEAAHGGYVELEVPHSPPVAGSTSIPEDHDDDDTVDNGQAFDSNRPTLERTDDLFPPPEDVPMHDPNAADDSEWVDDLVPVRPGEEAAVNSHAGGEYEFLQLYQKLLKQKSRVDDRTRSDRVQQQTASWEAQLPGIVEAYLGFKARGAPSNDEGLEEWQITVYSLTGHGQRAFFHPNDTNTINQTLMQHGYLGSSPERPGVAFSVETFEIYRQIHRLPRDPHLEDQVRIAYDAYLSIMRDVRARSLKALGRTGVTGFSKNICPPCTYKLRAETPLKPSMLGAIDGNSSLKMLDPSVRHGISRQDDRKLNDPRWIEPKKVDEYANEVKNAQDKVKHVLKHSPPNNAETRTESNTNNRNVNDASNSDEIPWLNVNETEQLASCIDSCVDRWKAAGPESNKKMWAMFEVTGIFTAVCRHGHVLLICDMIRSGELMKYPLAIVDELMNRYGDELGIGYDIMCQFYKTMLRSEKLGKKVVVKRLTGVVPAFHGHAHNHPCQLGWHPQYIEGVGLEDFEECERTYSHTNNQASTTRLATAFHRHQSISEDLHFHDEDKHAASGMFILQNYRNALKILQKNKVEFDALCKELKITATVCEGYLESERAFFKARDKEKEADSDEWKHDYVDLLGKYWLASKNSDDAKKRYKQLGTRNFSAKEIASIRTRYRTTLQRVQRIEEEVAVHEDEYGIVEQWTSQSPEYLDAMQSSVHRRYRKAIEDLERLVVGRLLELTKLNMSGVGYKQRTKIASALRSRAQAIRRALGVYNDLAVLVDRPTVTWDSIIDMVSLADFDLLKDSRLDLGKLIWAKPEHREAMRLHFSIRRAEEERVRLNVELKRLITFMLDDHADYWHAISFPHSTHSPDFIAELRRQHEQRLIIHSRIAERLLQTSKLLGFTGELTPGQHVGRDESITALAPLPNWAETILGLRRLVYDNNTHNAWWQGTSRGPGLSAAEMAQFMTEFDERDLSQTGFVKFMERLLVDSE
ncbi:hypothetical protein VNI00_004665 [Paramarasmius palmivorus]|uniref:CxC2-like cysteine cluster KDZ transposase-associated domain-containing protein n=1 Tax=Paramarasmius palmivorus TaxID=297713 RepID=A0AAW0DHP1_9AGAR